MKVRELMVRRVATVSPEDRLDFAVKRMKERNCGCLAVVNDEYRALAVVTDRDICMAALESDAPLSRLAVRNAMSPTLVTCQVEDSIAEAERLMGLHQVRRLPVVDALGRLEGLLSLDDIAREARREKGLIVPPVSAEAVGRTMGEIGRPHLVSET
ncbi:MAG: CBS domain-containing protein [Planctomycetes bacterium]|nr:CBS domain-containing protein [Planctomycetota bacterium]